MVVLTRSRRIREALRTVRASLPSKDWKEIERVVRYITAQKELEHVGENMNRLDLAIAKTSPFIVPKPGVDFREHWKNPTVEIVFSLPACRLLTDAALVGAVAHELAHCLEIGRKGAGWTGNISRKVEERRAWITASRWGFKPHIDELRREIGSVLLPYTRSRRREIIRRCRARALP